jgi:hypothetical protein
MGGSLAAARPDERWLRWMAPGWTARRVGFKGQRRVESHGGARAHDAALCGCRTVRGERRGDSSVMLASGGIQRDVGLAVRPAEE